MVLELGIYRSTKTHLNVKFDEYQKKKKKNGILSKSIFISKYAIYFINFVNMLPILASGNMLLTSYCIDPRFYSRRSIWNLFLAQG